MKRKIAFFLVFLLVLGTVQTFASSGQNVIKYATKTYSGTPNNLFSPEASVAQRFTINENQELTEVSLWVASHLNNIGNLTLTLYKWDKDYDTSIAGTVLAKQTFVNFTDNSKITMAAETSHGGTFLLTVTDPTERVAVYSSPSANAVNAEDCCFINGNAQAGQCLNLEATVITYVENGTGNFDVEFVTDFSSDEIKAVAEYIPNAGETVRFQGVIALYGSNNKLVAFELVNSKNNKAEIKIEKHKDAEYAKAFAWKTTGGLVPMKKTVTLKKTDRVNPARFVDFVVEVESTRDPVILQLTDTQIIDAAQERTPDRLGSTSDEYWATDKMDERCFDYLRETVNQTKPDLILLTGDLVYGEFDDDGTALLKLIEVMESFKIPWAPVFGNHENESALGADWQCEQLEKATYCLFKQRTLTGNGNYTVGITQGGILKRVFFMLDSNGCGGMSAATKANGHFKTSAGFGADQIQWYTGVAGEINRLAPDMKYSFVYHIQQEIFRVALSQYGTVDGNVINNPINIDAAANRAETDFGYLGRTLKGPWDTDYAIYNGMKALGCDSHFVGHEHCNSASVMYDGTRFQYGQKSSCYDRANYINASGAIVGSYSDEGTPIVGGTVMKMSKTDGSFNDCYIFYCDTAEGGIKPGDIIVPGMKYGTELSTDANINCEAAYGGGLSAYKCTAKGQGKVFINKELVKNQTTFTFEAFVPATSTKKLGGYGEFALRIKANELEPEIDSKVDGYIDFNSTSKFEELKIPFDEWKTYTVDISGFEEDCTEFSFVIPTGNIIYLRNLKTVTTIPGLSFESGELSAASSIAVETGRAGGYNAYELTALSQGKVYIDAELVKNKSTFTFDAFVPATSTKKLGGYGEFALRIKANDLEPEIDSKVDGYIDFNSTSKFEELKIPFGEWKTYTVDISGFKEACTEFAFVIASGNIIYIKNLQIK